MLLHDRPDGLLAAMVAVIVGREITVSALREWMAELGRRAKVSVNWTGKLKTGFQMTAIGMMIWEIRQPFGLPWYGIGYWLLVVASVLTLYSMMMYLRAAWPLMKKG
jgi:CDP-diacylglycerol--glycerol-3-phosphate 3-phosphatidyltransferase/cardiolipin synthase